MLPPKIGDGVVGSSSGGVKPTGASFGGATVFSSAAALILMVLVVEESMSGFGAMKEEDTDCFHGTVERSTLVFGAEGVGVKRVACVAMAMRER